MPIGSYAQFFFNPITPRVTSIPVYSGPLLIFFTSKILCQFKRSMSDSTITPRDRQDRAPHQAKGIEGIGGKFLFLMFVGGDEGVSIASAAYFSPMARHYGWNLLGPSII
jgi:hypothetical protein